jgi:hypothetical protein
VLLGTGVFRTNGGNLIIGGGSNPGGLVDPGLAATGARGTSTYFRASTRWPTSTPAAATSG